jgi:guanylate kinase
MQASRRHMSRASLCTGKRGACAALLSVYAASVRTPGMSAFNTLNFQKIRYSKRMEPTEDTTQAVTPHLQQLHAFEDVLRDSHLSPSAQKTLDETKIAVLVGPSSSGRNTIINKLLATGRYHFIVSDTTRPPRVNNGVLEQNGVEYWFRSEDELLTDLRAGKFLEAEIIHKQQVSGVSVRELEKAHQEHRIAITDVDVGGVSNVLRWKPDATVILILPPSFDEWQRRLKHRGRMSDIEWRRRIETSLRVFTAPSEDDYIKIVINENLEQAVAQVDAIAQTGVVDPALQAKGLHTAKELLFAATQALL